MPDLEQNANSPNRAKSDGQEVEQHSLKDQIKLDRYLASKKAAKKKRKLNISKLIPPGAE